LITIFFFLIPYFANFSFFFSLSSHFIDNDELRSCQKFLKNVNKLRWRFTEKFANFYFIPVILCELLCEEGANVVSILK